MIDHTRVHRGCQQAIDEELTDDALKNSIREFEEGLTRDPLGANLYKKRVAVGSKGKGGGLRTILVYKAANDKIFCIEVKLPEPETFTDSRQNGLCRRLHARI
jgi:hypothetical protein